MITIVPITTLQKSTTYFCINILIDVRYIVSIIPHFAMYLNMPEKGLKFQIDFHSHKFERELEIFIVNMQHKKF